MPKISTFLLAAIGLAALPVIAVPVTYIFQGTVTSSNAPGYAVGDPIRYEFVVDRDVDGTYSNNGYNFTLSDYTGGSLSHDNFFAEYIGGNAMATDANSTGNGQNNFGYSESVGYGTGFSSLVKGSNNDPSGSDFVQVRSNNLAFESWVDGQTGFLGTNESGTYRVRSNLTLVPQSAASNLILIPQSAAVPEPGTLALFGLGAGLLTFAVRRRKA